MPTKSSPCKSSSRPGASPTNTSVASGLPTPKAVGCAMGEVGTWYSRAPRRHPAAPAAFRMRTRVCTAGSPCRLASGDTSAGGGANRSPTGPRAAPAVAATGVASDTLSRRERRATARAAAHQDDVEALPPLDGCFGPPAAKVVGDEVEVAVRRGPCGTPDLEGAGRWARASSRLLAGPTQPAGHHRARPGTCDCPRPRSPHPRRRRGCRRPVPTAWPPASALRLGFDLRVVARLERKPDQELPGGAQCREHVVGAFQHQLRHAGFFLELAGHRAGAGGSRRPQPPWRGHRPRGLPAGPATTAARRWQNDAPRLPRGPRWLRSGSQQQRHLRPQVARGSRERDPHASAAAIAQEPDSVDGLVGGARTDQHPRPRRARLNTESTCCTIASGSARRPSATAQARNPVRDRSRRSRGDAGFADCPGWRRWTTCGRSSRGHHDGAAGGWISVLREVIGHRRPFSRGSRRSAAGPRHSSAAPPTGCGPAAARPLRPTGDVPTGWPRGLECEWGHEKRVAAAVMATRTLHPASTSPRTTQQGL